MPKKIDEGLKARAVRLVNDHQGEYSSLTAAAAVVAKQLGVGKESVRRWVIRQAGTTGACAQMFEELGCTGVTVAAAAIVAGDAPTARPPAETGARAT